jgi:hypothetical protein
MGSDPGGVVRRLAAASGTNGMMDAPSAHVGDLVIVATQEHIHA